MPVSLLEGDELGASDSCDGLGASAAAFGKKLAIAVSTVRLLLLGGELLSSQELSTVGAGEAVTMEGCVLVADAALVDHPSTLGALLCVVALIARHADDALLTGDEALVADGFGALAAGEALVMPVLALVLELLHTSTERLPAPITPRGEVVVMAVGAVDLVVLGGEGLVH